MYRSSIDIIDAHGTRHEGLQAVEFTDVFSAWRHARQFVGDPFEGYSVPFKGTGSWSSKDGRLTLHVQEARP